MKLNNFQFLLLRLILGTLFAFEGYTKINEGWLHTSDPLVQQLTSFQHNSGPQQSYYLTRIAIPYAGVWSRAMAAGEAAVAVSLILGCLVRLSSFTAIVMVLNFHAANGNLFSPAFFSNPWAGLLVTCLLVLLLARAGRWAGLDALFAKANSKGLLW
jgi:uncharacterized membrane protein YphA (DoxX/SURF4 family)